MPNSPAATARPMCIRRPKTFDESKCCDYFSAVLIRKTIASAGRGGSSSRLMGQRFDLDVLSTTGAAEYDRVQCVSIRCETNFGGMTDHRT